MQSKIIASLALGCVLFGMTPSARAEEPPSRRVDRIVAGSFVLLAGLGLGSCGGWLITKTSDPFPISGQLDRQDAPGYSNLGGVARYLLLPGGLVISGAGLSLIIKGARD